MSAAPSASGTGGLPPDFWSTLPLGPDVRLLKADRNGLAAFDKPAGVLSHPNHPGEAPRSLLNAAYTLDGEFYEWPAPLADVIPAVTPDAAVADAPRGTAPSRLAAAPRRLWLLNRLDSGTSGVILVAASAELAASIRMLFRQKHIKKTYHALVFGAPARPSEVWRDRLAVQKKGGQIRTAAGGNIPSEAHMKVLRARRGGSPPLALIQLEPRTGRSHQLRVQCAQRHLPIVGDATYGNFGLNRDLARAGGCKRLCLHSHHTEFSYEIGGKSHHFAATAPTPREFLQALGQA